MTIYKRTAIRRLPTARNSQKQFHFSVADNSVAVLFVYGQGNRVAVGEIQLPRSGMPLKEKKRTATLLTATEKIYMFLSSSPSVTKGKPFFFSSVKGSVHSQALTCKSSFDMLICACNTTVILPLAYMHAWHAVPSCKGNKIKTNSNKRIIVKFSLRPLHPARPRECV